MPTRILDSFALLAFFQDEPGANVIEKMLLEAQNGQVHLSICVVNLGEVWYAVSRAHSVEVADSYIRQVQSMPIEIVDVDWLLTRQAAEFKSRGNIAYADCFAAALAKTREAEVVTGDNKFKVLQDEVQVLWLK